MIWKISNEKLVEEAKGEKELDRKSRVGKEC